MRGKFQACYWTALLVCALACGWSIWADAQAATTNGPGTNAPAPATNAPSAMMKRLEQLQENPLTFGFDRLDVLQEHRFLGEPLWKYAASLVYILLAFYVSKLLDWISSVWLRKLAKRTATQLDDMLLEVLHGPIKLVVFVVLLGIGLGIFDWSPRAKLYLSKALIVIAAVALTYLAIKIVNVLLEFWERRHTQGEKFDAQLLTVLRISLTTFVLIVAVLVTAQNLNINITAAIASLSIGGLAVGLAAQDTLANVFGAVAVFVDKPFRVGDQIRLDGAEGTVENVGLRSTRVRSPEGNLIAVPNKTMGNAIITNRTLRPGIRTEMNFGLPLDTPSAKVRQAVSLLQEIYRGHPMTREVQVSFNQFAGAKINILLVHWWKGTDYQQYLAGIQEMNLAVKDRFEQEKIALV